MSDEPQDSTPDDAALPSASAERNAEDLPPVKPPSAGFIVQMFLVPGLIVLAVIAVWAMFGKIASSEQNWQKLVEEIKQKNPHRRWRGAMGLAQLLKADQDRGDKGEQLARNPEVANALCNLFLEELESKSNNTDDIAQQAYLARALGLLDVPEVVLPALQKAMQPDGDSAERKEIRKNAIASVAVIAGRKAEQFPPGDDHIPSNELKQLAAFPALIDDLIIVSLDEDPLIRQLGTYTLGLLPSPPSQQRLEVMLSDADVKTRVNAAIGLARQHSTKGIPVFETVFKDAAKQDAGALSIPEEKTAKQYFWIGMATVALFISAVWSAGSTRNGVRVAAGLVALASLTFVCWGIYDMVQHPSGAKFTDTEPTGDAETFAERRKKARGEQFEQVIMLINSLKAVKSLNPELQPAERKALAGLITPLVERSAIREVQNEAKSALQELQSE